MAKAEKEKTVWCIGVQAESDCHDNNDGEDSNEPYSYRGTTTTHWTVEGLKLLGTEDHSYGYRVRETVDVNWEPKKGQLYHLLYAVYSTGDSFGHDNGRCFEAIGVYKSRNVAEENEKRLREGKPSKKAPIYGTHVMLKMEGTTKLHPYNRPWDGYFESLDYLEVRSLVLN
jgi:hypothetical protein